MELTFCANGGTFHHGGEPLAGFQGQRNSGTQAYDACCMGEALFLSGQARCVFQVALGASDPLAVHFYGSSKAVGSIPSGCKDFPLPVYQLTADFKLQEDSLTRAPVHVIARCCPLGNNRLGMLCTYLEDSGHFPEHLESFHLEDFFMSLWKALGG